MAIPRLETPRLLLRGPRLSDAGAIFTGYAADPEVTRHLSWPRHERLEQTRSFLQTILERRRQDPERWPWVLVRREDKALLGMVELRRRGTRGEVGYVLRRRDWGRGYMTEALQAVLQWGFASPDLWRVQAQCHPANRASARVLEKVGMRREGRLRRYIVFPALGPEPLDVLLYAKVR